jgi:hypothetical protein
LFVVVCELAVLGEQYPKSMACQRIPLDFLVSNGLMLCAVDILLLLLLVVSVVHFIVCMRSTAAIPLRLGCGV